MISKVSPKTLVWTHIILTLLGASCFFGFYYISYIIGSNSIPLAFLLWTGDMTNIVLVFLSALWLLVYPVLFIIFSIIALAKNRYRGFTVLCILNLIVALAIQIGCIILNAIDGHLLVDFLITALIGVVVQTAFIVILFSKTHSKHYVG